MKIVTAEEMIQREQEFIAGGVTAKELMEDAGRSIAVTVAQHFPETRKVFILAGKGNNGGDGLVAARYWAAKGWHVRVALVEGEENLRELPREQLKRLRTEHPDVSVVANLESLEWQSSRTVVVDALLGVGSKGKLRPELAQVTAKLNASRAQHFFRTVAIDLPTGLPDDPEYAVLADLTVTVGLVKDFLVREDLAPWVGRIETVPLFLNIAEKRDELLTASSLIHLLPRRSALSHKNTYGRVLIVGGSPGFTGAPILTVQSALRTGPGLVNLAVEKSIYPIVAAKAPAEVMVTVRSSDKKFATLISTATALAIGPGLGTGPEATRTLAFVLKHATGPIVVDADALTLLAAKPSLFKQTKKPLILTPHPGEMKRLLKREFTPQERPAVARELSDKYGVIVVLKGTRTIIAIPGEPLYFNSTGNPGLAVGGSGDTLTGVIAALVAQRLAPGDAARLGVWLHGRAGDLALHQRGCEEGLLPTDVSEFLGPAIVSLRELR